jgi:hypothetical protein
MAFYVVCAKMVNLGIKQKGPSTIFERSHVDLFADTNAQSCEETPRFVAVTPLAIASRRTAPPI